MCVYVYIQYKILIYTVYHIVYVYIYIYIYMYISLHHRFCEFHHKIMGSHDLAHKPYDVHKFGVGSGSN